MSSNAPFATGRRPRGPDRRLLIVLAFVAAGSCVAPLLGQEPNEPTGAQQPTVEQPAAPAPAEPGNAEDVPVPRPVSEQWKRFSQLPLWEDGFSEMCYYDATCELQGKRREFTRVHLMNREAMDERRWIKAAGNETYVLPVLKMVISEEAPTENYNYRFLTTAYLERPSLEPVKVCVSSQEWSGHSFKMLQWSRFQENQPSEWSLDLCSYSDIPDEGDRWWPHLSNVDAYESLYLFARAVIASGGESRRMRLLHSLRHNHAADSEPVSAILRIDGEPREIKVPPGRFNVRRVVLDWEGAETWFDVETAAPFRLVAYQASDIHAELRFVERRAYWDPEWKSGFHKPENAP
ncbi:MAG: hypothetical protein HOP29_18330 [Phycisphaerales bacterium]|nr:hypothetical protein [Phycisphaerales bacterium]